MARSCLWMPEGKKCRHTSSTLGCLPAPPAPGQYPWRINTVGGSTLVTLNVQWGPRTPPDLMVGSRPGFAMGEWAEGGVMPRLGLSQLLVPLTTLGSLTIIFLTSRKLKLL